MKSFLNFSRIFIPVCLLFCASGSIRGAGAPGGRAFFAGFPKTTGDERYAGRIVKDSSLLLSAANLAIACDKKGKISSVVIDGKDYTNGQSKNRSGFYFMDVKRNKWYEAGAALKGSTTMVQEGEVPDAGLELTAAYATYKKAIKIDATVKDITGEDRLVRVQYRVPYTGTNMVWFDDVNTPVRIDSPRIYSTVTSVAEGQMASILPIGVVSNGSSSLAIGENMNGPHIFVVEYNNEPDGGYLSITFNFVLSKKTEKTPSQAALSFIITAPDPAWGLRSALQDYYDVFPEYFSRRMEEGGNWINNQFYTQSYGVEDFGIKINSTPFYEADKKNNFLVFRYVAGSEKWIGWPEKPKDPEPSYDDFMNRLMACLAMDDSVPDFDFKIGKMKESAAAILSSGVFDKSLKMRINSWYAYGPMVNFVVNGSPSIPGLNFFGLCKNVVMEAQRQARLNNSALNGIFMDNLNYPGIVFNYRKDHYATSLYPLLWDSKLEPALPTAFSQYEYAKGIHDIAIDSGLFTLANFAFPKNGAVMYVPLIDNPGGEIGYGWGDSFSEFAVRRALAYKKPWSLLLTQYLPGGEVKELTYGQREKIMRRGMVYGVFSNVLSMYPPVDAYNEYRPIFKKYVPALQLADRLGWSPVTLAKADKPSLILERYGSIGSGKVLYTMINSDQEKPGAFKVTVDCKQAGLSGNGLSALVAFDLTRNQLLAQPVKSKDKISFSIRLGPDEAAAVIIGSRPEIFKIFRQLQIDKALNRVRAALKDIAVQCRDSGVSAPANWSVLSAETDRCFEALTNMKPDKLPAYLSSQFKNAHSIAMAISAEMGILKKRFDVDVTDIYADLSNMLSGLFSAHGAEGYSVQGREILSALASASPLFPAQH